MKQRKQIGVLVMAYGTASSPEHIEAYYTHIRHGRPPTPELLADLQRRYAAIGGISPLFERTQAQVAGLSAALERLAPGRYRVALGMKHAPPFLEDGVAELAASGVQQVIGLVLAPHYSALSIGEYEERVRAAAPFEFTMIHQWHLAPGYVRFLADEVQSQRAQLASEAGIEPEAVEIFFTAHSLPARVRAMGDPYEQQLRETAEAVAQVAGLKRWLLAWQSAGRTSEAWLGPDLLQRLDELKGVRGVLVCPAGFVSDHLEVLYDLDIEAKAYAEERGMLLRRTRMPNDDPAFLETLAEVVHEQGGTL